MQMYVLDVLKFAPWQANLATLCKICKWLFNIFLQQLKVVLNILQSKGYKDLESPCKLLQVYRQLSANDQLVHCFTNGLPIPEEMVVW